MLARPTTPYQRFKGVARSACRNWGDEEEPDWAVGKLSSKGDWELDGVSGNFKATYDGDTAVHALDVEDYADSVEGQPEHAWVLLDKVPAALPKPKEATTEPPASKAAGKRKASSEATPAPPEPAPANTAAHDDAPAPPPAKKKAKRAPPVDAFSIRQTNWALVAGAHAVAEAVGKSHSKGGLLTDKAFINSWDDYRATCLALRDEFEVAIEAMPDDEGRLSKRGRKMALLCARKLLALPCQPSADVLASAVSNRKAAKPTRTTPGSSRKIQIKQELLAGALKKLAGYKYDLFDAASGSGHAYLSADELKQLVLDKDLYEAESCKNRMMMIKKLTQSNAFVKERKAELAKQLAPDPCTPL